MTAAVRIWDIAKSCWRWPSMYGPPPSNVTDQTVARDDDWSGDQQASCTWVQPGGMVPDWLKVGATYQHVEGPASWGGFTSAVVPGDDGSVSIAAVGWGSLLAKTPAFELGTAFGGSLAVKESVDPNAAVDYAIANLRLPLTRGGDLNPGATAIGAVQAGEKTRTLKDLLLISAANNGMRLYVDTWGLITMRADPVPGVDVPKWLARPGSAYMGTLDQQYVTHLYGKYLDSGNSGAVEWRLSTHSLSGDVGDIVAQAIGMDLNDFADLTALGPITGGAAQANIDGRFAKIGAQAAPTNSVDLTSSNTVKIGWGGTSPLSMCGEDGAGRLMRIPDVIDAATTLTFRATFDFLLGQVVRNHDVGTAVGVPIGLKVRDYPSFVAAATALVQDAADDAVLTADAS